MTTNPQAEGMALCARCKKEIPATPPVPEASTVLVRPNPPSPCPTSVYPLCAACTAALRSWIVSTPAAEMSA